MGRWWLELRWEGCGEVLREVEFESFNDLVCGAFCLRKLWFGKKKNFPVMCSMGNSLLSVTPDLMRGNQKSRLCSWVCCHWDLLNVSIPL